MSHSVFLIAVLVFFTLAISTSSFKWRKFTDSMLKFTNSLKHESIQKTAAILISSSLVISSVPAITFSDESTIATVNLNKNDVKITDVCYVDLQREGVDEQKHIEIGLFGKS